MKRFSFLILPTLFLGGIFLFAKTVWGSGGSIVISEVGAYEPNGYEWLEIYNYSDSDIDFNNWVFWENNTNHKINFKDGVSSILSAGEYAIVAEDDTKFKEKYPDVNVKIFDSSWGTLKESGEEIGLKDETGNFVEQFTYIKASNFSLERKNLDTLDYTATNWQEHPDSHTAGQANYWQTNSGTPEQTENQNYDLRINEFVPNPNSGEKEWIEIYNLGLEIDLNNWTLNDGVGTIYTFSEILAADQILVVELSGSKLNNGGDIVSLLNSNGEIVDSVTYGSWDDGDTSDNAPIPGKGESLVWSNGIYIISSNPSKGSLDSENYGSENENGESQDEGESVDSTNEDSTSVGSDSSEIFGFAKSDLVINELVSDPDDSGVEFVEIYNNLDKDVDLDGWYIEEGSESKTFLEGSILAKGFFVLEKPKGNLNNSGDILFLYSENETLIDSVTYGSWDDGNLADNALAADDPKSLARKFDGADADNDFFDFFPTTEITKGFPNVIVLERDSHINDAQTLDNIDTEIKKIVINEVFPNPAGADSEEEFIELVNLENSVVDLSGWKLGDKSSKRFTFVNTQIAAGELFVLKRAETGLALNNSGGDQVKLFDQYGSLVSSVSYKKYAEENYSYSLKNGEWEWTEVPTPQEENIIVTNNQAPIANIYTETEVLSGEKIIFDASDSYDPEGDELDFFWEFGDEKKGEGVVVSHFYNKEGIYTVELLVVDSEGNENKKKVLVNVLGEGSGSLDLAQGDFLQDIQITEIFPNPEGSDSTEFVEIYNAGNTEINLSALKIDDEAGGSDPYLLGNKVISPGEYLIFGKRETGLAFNNTTDGARLLDLNNLVLAEVYYEDVITGASFARDDNGVWGWTSEPTPGAKNILVDATILKTINSGSGKKSSQPIVDISLGQIRDFDAGDKVHTVGTVVVEPGIFGSQYFYIVDEVFGVQVYMHSKDFPNLKIGDLVSVSGEISQAYGETRLKVKTKDNIQKIDSIEIPKSKQIDIYEIGETLEGSFVFVSGEVTELKTSYMYVDDGTEEVKVYFKKGTGISKKDYAVGEIVKVTGLVGESRSGYQLLPRSKDDIEKIGFAEDVAVTKEVAGGNGESEVAEKYLTATAGGLTSILIGLFARARGLATLGAAKRFGGMAVGLFFRRRG